MSMSKRIVIDARIIGTSTGVYAENLLKHLQNIDSQNEYIVLLKNKAIWKPHAKNFKAMHAPYSPYTFSEQLGLAAMLYKLKPDLVHFTMPQQPLFYFGRRVTTIHDLILVKFDNIDMNPMVYKIRKTIFKILLRNVIWRSEKIIVPTEYVRGDVLDFSSDKYSSKMNVTLEAGEPLAGISEVLPELENKKFIFFVGNAFPYKNLRRIIDAFALLKVKHQELHLVFAGKKEFFYEQHERYVNEHSISDVHILGFISEGEKRWLFQNAQAYVVASLSEGFHIPGLEAMYEGCPVISSNATCLPEVLGNAALYFDPTNVEDLAKKIELLLGDAKLRDALITKGNKRVKQFSWRRMSQQTKDVYDQLLHDR